MKPSLYILITSLLTLLTDSASFAGTGVATIDFGGNDYPHGISVLQDGSILIAGFSYSVPLTGSNYKLAMARVDPHGILDKDFGDRGKVTNDLQDNSPYVAFYGSEATNANGETIFGGLTISGSGGPKLFGGLDYGMVLFRYNGNGTLDPTFGIGGKVNINLDGYFFESSGNGLALQTDGKALAAGSFFLSGSDVDFAVVRYKADGSLDTDFNGTGVVTTDFGGTLDAAYGLRVQNDGKILAAGYSVILSSTTFDFAMARYNSDGTPDTGFGTGGIVIDHFDNNIYWGNKLEFQPDGGILIAGYATALSGSTYNTVLVRYTASGVRDNGFGIGGKVTTDASYGYTTGIAVQSDGKIIVAGLYYDGAKVYKEALWRYDSNGTRDTSFGTAGKVITALYPSQSGYYWGKCVAIQMDRKIVVAGYSWNGKNSDFAVARYDANGKLDTTFGSAGPTSVITPPVITSPLKLSGTVGTPLSYQIKATHNPTSYSISGLPVDLGLSVNTFTGLLSGTPTVSGSFQAIINAINSSGSGSALVCLVISDWLGFHPIDLSPYANENIANAVQINPLPQLGKITLGGVPFQIATSGSNIWDAHVAAPIGGEAKVSVPVNLQNVSEVHLLLNTLWGTNQTGLAHVELVFDTGTYTRDLKGGDDMRDFQNWQFTNVINGTTSVRVFSSHSTINDVAGRIDKMVIPVPLQYQTARLLSVGAVDDGAPYVQRILVNGLTVRVGTGITVQQAGLSLSSEVSTVEFGKAIVTKKAPLVFTVTNNGAKPLAKLAVIITNSGGVPFSPIKQNLRNLAPGKSETFTTTYAPTTSGTHTATLHVASDDPAIPSFEIALTGSGVSFANQAGTFAGLLNDGMSFVTLALGNSGALTGKLILDGTSYPLSGNLDPNGDFTGSLGKPHIPLFLHIDLSGSSAELGGYAISGSAGGHALTAQHAAYAKGQTVAEAGTYTLLLNATDKNASVPQGTGYATLTVNQTGGTVTMAGRLADNTAFSSGGVLVGGTGGKQFIVSVPTIYSGKGLLAGAITFQTLANSDCDGILQWFKPHQTSGSYYKEGFDTDVALAGSIYIRPLAGKEALPIKTGTFELTGGSLAGAIQEPVTLLSNNTVIVTGLNPEHLSVTINATAGSLTGSFVHPIRNKKTTFSGLLFQNPNAPQAGGFFLGPVISGSGLSGAVSLMPAP